MKRWPICLFHNFHVAIANQAGHDVVQCAFFSFPLMLILWSAIPGPIEKYRKNLHGNMDTTALNLAVTRLCLCKKKVTYGMYYRKRFLYCAWGALGERERYREREREREKDGSDVTLVAIKLAMNFAPFIAKNLHLSIGEEFCTFPCQKFAP